MNKRTLTSFGAVSLLALSVNAGLYSIAHAQDAPPPGTASQDAEKKETQQMGEIAVTGSSIPTAPDEVAVPVVVVDAAQIAQSGVNTNALEILRKTVPAFAGRSNAGNSNANNNNQNTAGGSQLQLRNLPTLILVNGRRVANSGIGAINGKNFVDVSQIPAAALDRIEVLIDGASSIYGSDAIGGVVNFILKSDYTGLTMGARVADADNYGEHSAYVTGGGTFGGFSLVGTLSINHSDPLAQNTRSFTSPLYGKTSSIPGTVGGANYLLAPGLNTPSQTNPTGTNATAGSITDLVNNGTYAKTTPGAVAAGFDVSPYQTLLLRQNMDSFAGSVTKTLNEENGLELFGDLMLSHGTSFTRFLPVASTGNTVPAGAPFNPLTTNFTGVTFDYLPYTHNFENDVNAYRGSAGLRGHINDEWTWETAFVYSESDLDQKQTGLIYKPNISKAIAGGYDANGNLVAGGNYSKVYSGYSLAGALALVPALDPFARSDAVNPAALANLYGNELINTSSKLTSFDAKLVGTLFNLPAGEVGAATGFSARRESLAGHTDPNGRVTDPETGSSTGNDQQWLGGTYADPFSKSRDIYGVFGEVRIPITSKQWNAPALHALDVTLAGRGEKYSDAGSSFVPKYGFRWEPVDSQFAVRGNYSKSFTAPTLFSEYGPTDTRQVGPAVIQGVFGPNYTGMPFNGEDGNNPNLEPAKSTSKLLGFTLRPNFIPKLSIAVDYSNITLKGFPGGIGFNTILSSVNSSGSASPYFNNLAVDAFPGESGATQPFVHPGDLQTFITDPATGKGDPTQAERLFAVDQFQNLASLKEKSLTVSADYLIPTDNSGTFRLATNGAIFEQFLFQALPGQAFIQYAGNSTNSGVFGGTLPKFRFYTTLDWTSDNWQATLGNTYVSPTDDTGPNGTSTPAIHVSSYVSWDVRLGYDFHLAETGLVKVVRVAVGVNNIADRMPPLAPRAFLDNNADVATFSPIGRLTYVTASMDF